MEWKKRLSELKEFIFEDSHDHLSDKSHVLTHCDSTEPSLLSPPTLDSSSQTAEVPFSVADLHDESVSKATSLSSLSSFSSLSSLSSLTCSKPVSPWSMPQSCDRPPLSSMDSGGADCISCLLPKNQSCESVLGLTSDFQSCPSSNIGMQCLSSVASTGRYGDQVLSDQLLSGPPLPPGVNENAEEGKSLRESESDDDPTSRSIYESLGEEAQDWSCLESLISESRMELLDLCSRSELAVNLFCEEDVENYMFQDEESNLGTDVCSLKIRYESYPDVAQERTEVPLQDESQLGFFPTLPCSRTESLQDKADQSSEDKIEAPTTPNSNFLFDLSNSPEDSGEFSDDSYCTGSSPDTWQAQQPHGQLSRENSSSSSQLSYRLRAKRKVAFREDYLYDVDSIESERNAEKRKKLSVGPKKEWDDEWCPKKRRRSCRKEPPVIIKYIIINRFKGEKHMQVKLSRVEPLFSVVNLNPDTLLHYEKLAPLKAYWQKKEKEQQEQNSLAAADKTKRLNGCKRPPSSTPKRKQRRARLRIQRVPAVETPIHSQTAATLCNNQQEMADSVKSTEDLQGAATHDALDKVETGKTTHPARAKSRTQEREERRKLDKTVKIKKFKSEARLRAKKLQEAQIEDNVTASELTELSSCLPENLSDSLESNLLTNETSAEKCTLTPTAPGTNENVDLLPGGYLQTLLEASVSSSSTNGTYFSTDQQQTGLLSVADPLQPVQTCVLSPPSESELPQSPQPLNHIPHQTPFPETDHPEQSYSVKWPSQPTVEQLAFSPDIPTQSPVMPSGFPRPMPVLAGEGTTVTGYSQVPLGPCRMAFEEPLLPEPHSDTDYGRSPVGSRAENGMGRLVSFNSLGSLSAASSNYSSLSLRDNEREREEEMSEISDGFLSHCSPQLVLQQSLEEITPLRESTDLLDISNFTPDKFRHSSLSEMSPPDTPSPSPQLLGNCGKGGGFVEAAGANVRWTCSTVPQVEQDASQKTHLIQTFTEEEDDEGLQGLKRSKKKGGKNGQSTKKTKTPKAAKGEKVKLPKQGSNSAKKIKALLEGKAAKCDRKLDSGAPSPTPSLNMIGAQGDWPHAGALSDDDQGEFQEPSNILSNIVSGMAEVQRFMRASVEPLWGPCLSPGQHTLQSQTLKILGSSADLKKRGSASGASKGKKGTGGKASSKLLAPGFFPPIGLDCLPLPHRPAHKKMYRHKSTTKFARDEVLSGKRDIKGVALAALVEKQR
ncbi:protein KIAA2022-like [Silurus asotus]|uniref:Protein KIAA2022-like n=1 Tax=Silurus asotus TaxID=30991 RepID=A0AAD5BA24_SILAS|nr:protein KIAA2022-like [Silurus asotus]